MFDALYPEAADAALATESKRITPAPPTPWFKGAWSAIGKAVPRAGAEMGRAMTSLQTPEAIGAMDAPTMFSAPGKTPKPQLAEELRQQDAALRDAIKEMTPDAETTGAASMILHDVTRFVGKAAAYSAMGGVAPAVVGMGLDEGYNEAARRMDEGVDAATAAKLGLTHGVASAAAVAFPVAGKTIAQTVGLALAGGPATYIAEQATAREILQSAGYSEQAGKIDPFDPLGLGISFLGPLVFGAGAHAVRARNAKFEAKLADERMLADPLPPGEQTPVALAARQFAQEHVDAALTTELRAHREAQALHAREDLAAGAAHERALDTASEQLAAGQRVSVADVAPADGARIVEAMQPAMARLESIVADLQARALPPEQAAANFQTWFAGSKVVDAEGKPLVLYHGTPRPEFDEFSLEHAGKNTGNYPEDVALHFTDRPETANYYADVGGPNGAVMPVYVSLKNPLHLSERVLNRDDIAAAKAAGHDGIISTTERGREFVVFSPKQAKSAIGNSGRFDPNSPSLTDAIAPPRAAPVQTGDPVTDAITTAAREIQEALAPTAKPTEPTADYLTTETARIEQTDPDMLVMLEGMDGPRPMREVLAEIKAMADQEIADAPLMQVAATCALRG
jgi:hypothetical protein